MSDAKQRAVQKEVLLMRAEIERMELLQNIDAIKQSLKPIALLRAAVPQAAASKGPGLVLELIKRYPWFSAAATVVASRNANKEPGVFSRIVSSVGLAVKASVVSGAAYAAYQAYKAFGRTR